MPHDNIPEDLSGRLYYLASTLSDLKDSVDDIEGKVNTIHVDVEVMKQTSPAVPRKERVKDGSIGGGIGAVLVTLMIGVWEYFKKH